MVPAVVQATATEGTADVPIGFPPRRLEAEAIRDAMLSVAGKLDLTMGGPGFRLFDYRVDNVADVVGCHVREERQGADPVRDPGGVGEHLFADDERKTNAFGHRHSLRL